MEGQAAAGSSPLPEAIQEKFDLGIAIALFDWSALTLAVQNEWGGSDSREKREWFVGAVSDMFANRPQTDLEDVETTLLQVMLDEFEVNVEDETAFDVAQQIMRLRAATQKGDFAEVDAMHAAWLARKNKAEVRYQKVESGDDDDTDRDGDDHDSSDDDAEDEDMQDVLPMLVEKKDNAKPEVDEEGFTKVEEALSPDEASEKTKRGEGEKPTLNTEFAEAYKAISSSPWGARFGALVGTVKKQGETYYDGARKEYSAASSQVSKGLSQIIEQNPLSPGMRGSPFSSGTNETTQADAGTSASSSDDKTRSDSEALRESESILARFRLEASKRLKDIEKAEDAADEALLKFGTNIRNFFRDAVAIAPPADGGNGVDKDGKSQTLFASKDRDGKRVIHTTRFDAQLHVIHSSRDSFLKDPASPYYASWKETFSVEKQTDEIATDLEKFEELRSAMEQLVPDRIKYEDFWSRYYFLRLVVQTDEQRRKEMLKGAATGPEEEVDWDEDSGPEDSEGKSASQTTMPRSPASMNSSSTLHPTSASGEVTRDTSVKPGDPRRSNDQHSQPDSDASYDVSRPHNFNSQNFLPNGATGGPGGGHVSNLLPNHGRIVQSGGVRVLCVADVRGNLRSLNELAKQARADHIVHTGDFGFYDDSSLERIADKTLRHVAQYSPLLSESVKKQISQPGAQPPIAQQFPPEQLPLSELPQFLNKTYTLDVPVYTVWGACEDVRVLEKFRSGEYKVDKLHIIDEANSRLLEVGGVKLRLLGLGGAVVMHKIFDNSQGRTTIAGGHGTMWTTLLQMSELVDTANRVYDPTETRVFVTHASPAREGLLNQLSVTLKADFSISAGLHFRYGSSYNEFSVNPTLDHYRGKLAASKASFYDVWETVKGEVEQAVSQNEAQQTLLQNALEIVHKMPTVANGGNPFGGPAGNLNAGGQVDESAFKNMWNFNLADAAFGWLVLEVEGGRIGTEMRAQGFNFAHRGGKHGAPLPGQHQAVAPSASSGTPGGSSALATSTPTGPTPHRGQAPPGPNHQQGGPMRNLPDRGQQVQGKSGPGPTRANQSPAPTAANQGKPATPQPPSTIVNLPAAAAAEKSMPQLQTDGARNGASSKAAAPSPAAKNPSPTERKPSTALFVSFAKDEESCRGLFPDSDRSKINRIERHKSGAFVVHFDNAEEAKAVLDRLPADLKKKGEPDKPSIKPFLDQHGRYGHGGATEAEATPLAKAATEAAVERVTARQAGAEVVASTGVAAIAGEAIAAGVESFFGAQLPCPDNAVAEDPSAKTRKKLVEICGTRWAEGPICCEDEQIDALGSNLKSAEAIISACPACKANFFNLFCTFTCSPDQSLFLNVTDTGVSRTKETVVTELDFLVADRYGSGFYDSCKDVKFGAANTRAMDFIGGGAKNYTDFLKFLGHKNPPFGSPFQMNFPRSAGRAHGGMEAMHDKPKSCGDEDERYRCSCVDCPDVCPELPEVTDAKHCHVGPLPCVSFGVIIAYAVVLLLLVAGGVSRVLWRRHAQSRSERLRLLRDAAPSDDEDEGDIVHGAGRLDRPRRYYHLNTVCDVAFSRLGKTCARFPAVTIGISVVFVALLSLGWINFAVETNPVRLWVSPASAAAEEKTFFDANFGPFYRAQQAFLVNDTGSVLSYETLGWWFDVENRVQRLKSIERGVTFNDVCFKPTGDACVVQSLTGYFGGAFSDLNPETWQEQLQRCIDHPVECLPDFQQPLRKEMILGGWKEEGDVSDSKALIVTWVVDNHDEGTDAEARAMDWEQSLKSLLMAVQGEAEDRGLRLSFSTEISLEQELNKSTNTDAKIVVISYVIMFLYASLALGSETLAGGKLLKNPADALVQSKFTLGVSGIVIVLMSVSASVGLFSAMGIKVTLIIAEVIPFLVLAVGVDNIFLIVHELERVNLSNPDEHVEDRVAKALGRMGPSILLSASTETIAFALGAFVGMPAVRNFAVYAAGAVLINAVLQVTMFIAVLTLNQRRVEDSRADCFPCVRVKKANRVRGSLTDTAYANNEEGAIQKFIRKTYAPALLKKTTKTVVLVAFGGLFTAGLALIPTLPLGLDQRIAIPKGSYLIQYFDDLYDFFDSGPPVYFVTREMNVTQRTHQQQLCARFSTCDSYSLANILEQERKRPEVSYIAEPAAIWIDDFFLWLNPTFESCCTDADGNVCFKDREPPWNTTLHGMPEGREFVHYLDQWLDSPTTKDCALGGKAAYGTALVVDEDRTTIPASHFRSSHTPLRSQSDFIEAYASARRMADAIGERTGAEVFPYSKFYIFFDQYAGIVGLTAALLGSALGIILVITSILLGSVRTGLVVTVTVAMIVVDVIGTMALVGVSLNAVSLVNLVICVGIGVEFCAHIARAFMFPSRNVMERGRGSFRADDARAWTALVNVGGSVFSGITITKLLGVFVLAFTRSKIFEVYYFRIWLALVLFAATHALVFLPVALSLFGGAGYVDPGSDGGLEDDLASRRYRALLPDGEDDDEDSDE
ncbi:MAG: hypothetical protein M1832_006196 [Thelocarpon impressellum]|nr:MAG: hypothetical protein M1832_006196 [Thelocarpon impressellum]